LTKLASFKLASSERFCQLILPQKSAIFIEIHSILAIFTRKSSYCF